jgi:hypothetical protein
LIVAPESDSTSVRDPVYVGVGDGLTRDENGETVTAGLAEAVPADAPTVAEAVALGIGDLDELNVLDVAVAQPARTRSATAKMEDLSVELMLV